MPNIETSAEYKLLWAKHLDEAQLRTVHPDWTTDSGRRFKARWLELVQEAERLKNTDPGSPQALDLARRALSLVGEFTRFNPELMASLRAVHEEGYADPNIAPHMPNSEQARRFMDAAVERLHAIERPSSSAGK